MRIDTARGFFLSVLIALLLSFARGETSAATPGPELELKRKLIAFLDGGKRIGQIGPDESLSPLGRYPFAATTAYLLLGDDPGLLAKYYPAISDIVLGYFAEENLAPSGLIQSDAGQGSGARELLSPAMNVLADLDLYSLHLIAWRIGKYDDALDFLGWSNRLSETVTKAFYDPATESFRPIDANNRFLPAPFPDALTPLVTDRILGQTRRRRVIDAFVARNAELTEGQRRARRPGLWSDPFVRPVVLDLLSNVIDARSACFEIAAAMADTGAGAPPADGAAWVHFWRRNPSARRDLFPSWRTVATLVNLTLLLEHDSLLAPKDMSMLKSGVDSLASALAATSIDLDSYRRSIAAANRLLGQLSRISEVVGSEKDRWRVIDVPTWLRLSPRSRRLIQEGWPASIDDVRRAKVALSARLAASGGISLDVDLPVHPVRIGAAIPFTARLSSARDTLEVSRAIMQVGDNRWNITAPGTVERLIPGGAPVAFAGTLGIPPETEPGIVPFFAFADFLSEGRRIELDAIASVALSSEYDVAFTLPDGRRIGERPVPIEIAVSLKPDHDVRGTVDGTFLRELGTTPALPAKFLLKGGSERTDLTITVSPKMKLSPGRYPFALTVSLDGRPLAAFENSLVKPFKWLSFGPLSRSERILEHALAYQTDILKPRVMPDGDTIRWQEVPVDATDPDGALWPERISEMKGNGCMLLYTVVDAPSRMNLLWKLSTKNAVSLWVNSAAVVSGENTHQDEMAGPIELRKGPNSFLFAVCWRESPDRISFELGDENGLPPTALNNDIETIIDGYERLSHIEQPKQQEVPPPDRLQRVTFTIESAEAAEVCVIGSFNNWEPGKTPMKKVGATTWTTTLILPPGRYPYKFLVNRKTKIVDPKCALIEADGFGGSNSVLEVR